MKQAARLPLGRVLLVEDSEDDFQLMRLALHERCGSLVRVELLSQALRQLAAERFDVAIVDLSLPDSHGLETFTRLHAQAPDLPIIVLTGYEDEDLGLRTVQRGAQDYLVKGLARDSLVRALHYAIERKHAQLEVARYARELQERNEELERDLSLAREIQQDLLPLRYPTFPAGAPDAQSALHFRHLYRPAGPVGGDFFQVVAASSTEAGVFICDVMGHGVRAALVTAMLRTLLGELSPVATQPGPLLTQLNRGLRSILAESRVVLFVSAFYLVADLGREELRYANAGHPWPLLCRAGRSEHLHPIGSARAPALGLSAGVEYPTHSCPLSAGDRLLLFTDGLYEVEGAGGEIYGAERLRDTLQRSISLPPGPLFEVLLAEIRRYGGDRDFEDDLCMVCMDVERVGQPEALSGCSPR
jgi:phosphoserine phosphatase RsbU/P